MEQMALEELEEQNVIEELHQGAENVSLDLLLMHQLEVEQVLEGKILVILAMVARKKYLVLEKNLLDSETLLGVRAFWLFEQVTAGPERMGQAKNVPDLCTAMAGQVQLKNTSAQILEQTRREAIAGVELESGLYAVAAVMMSRSHMVAEVLEYVLRIAVKAPEPLANTDAVEELSGECEVAVLVVET